MNRLPRPLIALVLAAVVAAIVAGCGDDDTTATTGDGGASGSGPTADVVVQVRVGGGFVAANMALSTVPTVTVLADGTVLTVDVADVAAEAQAAAEDLFARRRALRGRTPSPATDLGKHAS